MRAWATSHSIVPYGIVAHGIVAGRANFGACGLRLGGGLLLLAAAAVAVADDSKPVGVQGPVGCGKNPKKVSRLQITKAGVYENFLVDSHWADGNRVKITANDVTLRHCEIRNAGGNGVGVFGMNVLIEGCKIHHCLAGTFKQQRDAHGITGRWGNVTIRNCEIYHVSGDCIQFDPDRRSAGRLLVENCTLYAGPLPADSAGFKRGQRPGENAFDSKTPPTGPRCKLEFRNCLMHGWNQPGQISLLAALNIKENVDAVITRCLFQDNQVCFRLRGPTRRGGAQVSIDDCAIYDSMVGVRMEDGLRNLRINRLGVGSGIDRKIHMLNGPFPGYRNAGEYKPPAFETLQRDGFGP